jgi:aquaporin related protein
MPQVTTALWVVGLIKWQRAVHSVLAQLLAGVASAFVVSALLPGPLPVATVLEPSTSITRGLFLEAFMTTQLILVILLVPAGAAKPMYIGFTLFAAEICSVYFTGGSLNPARSFGPAIVVGFESYHWIYWLGPALGAGLATGTFVLIGAAKGRDL